MNFSRFIVSASLVALVSCQPASFAVGAENCYAIAKVPAEKQIYTTSVVVLLDETVVFDVTQREHIQAQVRSLIVHGNEIRAFTFSAFRDGRYTMPVMDVRLALPLDEAARYTMRKDSIRDFDTCQIVSMNRAKKEIDHVLEGYFERSSSALANSDILATLKQVGDTVIPAFRGKRKQIVLVSDMLENSDISSFYGAGGSIRTIDVGVELAKVEKRSLLSDFRGASVFVIGAGVAPTTGKVSAASYRAQSVMAPLNSFWAQYFERSNSKLIEFGQPLLLKKIGDAK